MPTRDASPWHAAQEPLAASAFPFRCAPDATLMVPSRLTLSAWQAWQDFASAAAPMDGWPAGGIAWQEAHVTGVASDQTGRAFVPETPPYPNEPWQ
jgi:hypothetical protein